MVVSLFVGGAQPQAVGLILAPWDKLGHMAFFVVLAGLLQAGLPVSRGVLIGLCLAVGAADEIHQAYLPGRQASLEDWLADAVGVGLAMLAGWWADRRQR